MNLAYRLRTLALVAVVALIVWGAGTQPGLILLAAFTAVVALGLFVAPKMSMALIGGFLLVQPAAVNLAGGAGVPLGLALQRLHQGFIVASTVRIGYFMWAPSLAPTLRRWVLLSTAFVASGLLSALLAGVPASIAALGAFLAVKFQVFLLLALTIAWTERDCRRIVGTAVWLGPLLLCTGVILQHLPADIQAVFMSAGAEEEGFFSRGDLTSMQGIMSHPGAFGWAMAVTTCYAMATLLTTPSFLGVVSLGSGVLGILASLRRKPLIALPVAILLGLVRRRGSGAVRWRTIVIVVLVVAGIAGLTVNRLQVTYADTLAGYFDPYAPTAPRTLLYLTGLKIGADRFPLGEGFGRYGGYASRINYSPVYDQYGLSGVYGLSPDNPLYLMDTYWPHILGETGWIGVAILVVFFAWLLRDTRRVAQEARLLGVRTLALAAGMVLVEALVESLASPIFETALFAFVIAVPLGITIAPLDDSPRARLATSGAAVSPPPSSPAAPPQRPPESLL